MRIFESTTVINYDLSLFKVKYFFKNFKIFEFIGYEVHLRIVNLKADRKLKLDNIFL